jgi:uncharacterized protein (DUF1786 family)
MSNHQHHHEAVPTALHKPPVRILAIDVGAGTQDILLYDSRVAPENCVKLVVPSQTQIVGRRIRAVTAGGLPLHLTGSLMGGGASGSAVAEHLKAGLPVSATSAAAGTLHNNLDRVRAMGVSIQEEPLPGSTSVELRDIDLAAIASALESFAIELPEIIAVAVQDHGFRPGSGNNEVRFDYLQGLIDGGGELVDAVFQAAPPGMTRMQAMIESVPGAYVMDTGAAALLGSLGDPLVARAVETDGAILVNVGNMHTFAALVRGRRLFGLFEHHTGGITAEIIGNLIEQLRHGTIDLGSFRDQFDGHGAALDPAYRDLGPFAFVAVTGPNRGIARPLGYHEAAPHGDMMLTGSFGLAEGVLMKLAAQGRPTGVTLAATS